MCRVVLVWTLLACQCGLGEAQGEAIELGPPAGGPPGVLGLLHMGLAHLCAPARALEWAAKVGLWWIQSGGVGDQVPEPTSPAVAPEGTEFVWLAPFTWKGYCLAGLVLGTPFFGGGGPLGSLSRGAMA